MGRQFQGADKDFKIPGAISGLLTDWYVLGK
jgi:hypothetical protein